VAKNSQNNVAERQKSGGGKGGYPESQKRHKWQ